MGCGASKTYPHGGSLQDKQNRETEMIIEEEKNKDALNFKILCLGPGESGKSTLIKQLVFVHRQKITDEERRSYIRVLHSNTIQCMQSFLKASEQFGLTLNQEQTISAAVINAHDAKNEMTPNMVEDIVTLWKADAIQRSYLRRSEFWHLEASDYYFTNCHRFVDQEFVPTDEDIVMCRKRTTGVVVTDFDYGDIHWSVVDVGGQRSERRKWLHCFDNVKAVMWVVNLADYNNVLFEDKNVNRMHESLELFKDTVKQDFFRDVPIFLFLNKKDLFEHMIKSRGIECCFPDYKGNNDLNECCQFVEEQFQSRLPSGKPRAMTFFLAARVRKEVQYAFDDLKDALVKGNKGVINKALKQAEKIQKKKDQAEEAEQKG